MPQSGNQPTYKHISFVLVITVFLATFRLSSGMLKYNLPQLVCFIIKINFCWPVTVQLSCLPVSSVLYLCNETTLTGESRFHRSTLLGIEQGSLMTGSKGLTHWTSETVYECSEIAGSPSEGRPAANMKLGKLCEIKWDYHIVSTTA